MKFSLFIFTFSIFILHKYPSQILYVNNNVPICCSNGTQNFPFFDINDAFWKNNESSILEFDLIPSENAYTFIDYFPSNYSLILKCKGYTI